MIYRLDFDRENFFCIDLDQDDMEERMGDLYYPEGLPLSDVWTETLGELYDGLGKNRALNTPDIASWEGAPVFNEQAFQLLGNNLKSAGEFLPVTINGGPWFIFNTLAVSNAIDHAHSEQNLRGGIYMGLKSLNFIEGEVGEYLLFKTDFDERVGIYCTETFRSLIRDCGVTGLKLRKDLHCP